MPGTPLQESITGVVPASGNLTLTLGPKRPKQIWRIYNAAVSTSTSVLEPKCVCYASPRTRLGGTETGSNDNIPMAVTINANGSIIAEFTGADVGATAELTLYGGLQILGQQ